MLLCNSMTAVVRPRRARSGHGYDCLSILHLMARSFEVSVPIARGLHAFVGTHMYAIPCMSLRCNHTYVRTFTFVMAMATGAATGCQYYVDAAGCTTMTLPLTIGHQFFSSPIVTS